MKANAALFIGHSACYGITSEQIELVIIDLIKQGVDTFYSGGQGDFDKLCAECVYKLKKHYSHIKNFLVIPYLTFRVFNKKIFDEIIFPEGFEKYHFKAAIPARNIYMLDKASIALCYVNHGWGGAAKTYEKAIEKKLKIINLGTYEL